MPVLVRSVAASAGDVKYATGLTFGIPDIETLVGSSFGGWAQGHTPLLFGNITIPKLSIINSAYLTMTWNMTAAVNISYIHRSQAIDNAPLYTNEPEFLTRVWSFFTAPGTFNGAAVAGNAYNFPENLNFIMTEVIHRAGWVSGNNIALCVFNNASVDDVRFRSWDHGTGPPAELTIDYTPPGEQLANRRRYHNFK